jgi:hypothetical protein
MSSEKDFVVGKTIYCNNKMDKNYSYVLSAPYGKVRIEGYFEPFFTPLEMLKLGVFEGKYINDCRSEFPVEWYKDAKISAKADYNINYFKIKSRQSLRVWRDNGWLYGVDNRGWFQWYCRYYCGRRNEKIDELQIKRWRAFKRHYGQVLKNCLKKCSDKGGWCRPKQRQALLQWSYNCFI